VSFLKEIFKGAKKEAQSSSFFVIVTIDTPKNYLKTKTKFQDCSAQKQCWILIFYQTLEFKIFDYMKKTT